MIVRFMQEDAWLCVKLKKLIKFTPNAIRQYCRQTDKVEKRERDVAVQAYLY